MFGILLEIPQLSIPFLGPVLNAQTGLNWLWLRSTNRPPPPLYQSGVFYYEDPHHGWSCPVGAIPDDTACPTERFSTIPGVWARRYGDCKDLATWRAAELWAAGEPGARAIAIPSRSDPRLIHIVVERANGSREDPSQILGMGDFFAAKHLGVLPQFFAWAQRRASNS